MLLRLPSLYVNHYSLSKGPCGIKCLQYDTVQWETSQQIICTFHFITQWFCNVEHHIGNVICCTDKCILRAELTIVNNRKQKVTQNHNPS